MTPHRSAIRVVVIEDVREVREGLALLIDETAGFRCVGSFRTIENALAGMDAGGADVIRNAAVGDQRIDCCRRQRRVDAPQESHVNILYDTFRC